MFQNQPHARMRVDCPFFIFKVSRTNIQSIVDHSNCRRDLPTAQVTGMIHSKEEGDDIEAAEHVKHVGEKIPATRILQARVEEATFDIHHGFPAAAEIKHDERVLEKAQHKEEGNLKPRISNARAEFRNWKKKEEAQQWIGRRKKYQFYLFAVQIHNSPLLNQWRQRGTEESFIFQSCQTNIRGYFLRVAASWIEQVSIEIYQLFKLLV
ncbi:hypothetical protein TIFTF001_050838 [Ficus carica]|uniref:Uncharacterized protein n=1 Tax=Ficus carica TaxID=3494 RepID=A0AA88CJH3_FICCA|nr:hypothetical protein TIFTF001_050838 [Ficus carica]